MRILINETQLPFIQEAIPYKVVAPYLKIDRTEIALKAIKKVFDNLKNLPNAKIIDKRGDRIAFPYKETSLEDQINSLLSKHNYKVSNFDNNEAIAISKDNEEKEIKITKALGNLLKKDAEAEKLLDLYSTRGSKNIDSSKTTNLIIVFSKHPYDIAGMSYDRTWDSCMHLSDGGSNSYVKHDIENGTIIAYLCKENDITIKNPIGRILIKPYVNDLGETVLYPEFKTYGDIENPGQFIEVIDNYLINSQSIKTKYKLLHCIYPDSPRKVIGPKDIMKKHALEKLEGEYVIDEHEIEFLNKDEKYRYIEYRINQRLFLYEYEFDIATKKQKRKSIEKSIFEVGSWLEEYEFKYATDEEKLISMTRRKKLGYSFTLDEREFLKEKNITL
jgi:hypothetical protein